MRISFLSNRVNNLQNRISSVFLLPERFKGTIVEKWITYWKNVTKDYAEVTVGVVKEAVTKPRKAAIYGTTALALYSCYERNPDEEAFVNALRRWNNRMILVSPSVYNVESSKHLKQLEEAVNQNKLRTMSLGILSLVWLDLYDQDDCTYPAICDYTKVGYWNFHERIIDVGFWNKFWRLEFLMRNYDVNYL